MKSYAVHHSQSTGTIKDTKAVNASLRIITPEDLWSLTGCQCRMWNKYHPLELGPKWPITKPHKGAGRRAVPCGGGTMACRVIWWLKIRLVESRLTEGEKSWVEISRRDGLAVHGSEASAGKAWELLTRVLTSLWLLLDSWPQRVNRAAISTRGPLGWTLSVNVSVAQQERTQS